MKPTILCIGIALLLQPALGFAFNEPDDAEEMGYERSRRGWSMMRLGRGLQMLRLGKRTAPSPPADTPQSTPEQMRALLSALVDESRKEFRRQPPLPRYGRELDQDAVDELYNLLGDAYLSRAFPYLYNRYVHANRFKRSASTDARSSSFSGQSESGVWPRFGQYLGHLHKLRPAKAVPVPRIGRQDLSEQQQMRSKDLREDSTDQSLSHVDSDDVSSLAL